MNHYFKMGFLSIIPIISGIIPFAAVMGTSFANSKLTLIQAMFMNMSVYAGASQLAAIDLMKIKTSVFIVLLTGIIINLRFILYSAILSQKLRQESNLIKFLCAFTLTDQSYAVMHSAQKKFITDSDAIQFYLGSALCMFIVWHTSVMLGFLFGNFAPSFLSLDFAVPLSFLAMLIPTLQSKKHKLVAVISSILSIVFYQLPFRSGLIGTAATSLLITWLLIAKKKKNE